MKIQTEALHFSADAQLLSSVERKVSKLENFFNRIIEARVILKLDNLGLKYLRIAEIKLQLPNGIIFTKEGDKTFDAALDKALVAMKLQLLRYKTKRLSYCFA
jgi:putative sigma-54 modulation protein